MAAEVLIIGCLLLFAAANIVVSLLIVNELNRRGIRTNFLLLRLLIFRYLGQYRAVTLRETGKTGPLFGWWIISINLMAVSAIVLLITH